MKKSIFSILILFLFLQTKAMENTSHIINKNSPTQETIVLGAGCFWCIEAVFTELKGVEKVESGYSGGEVKNPTYEEVCEGNTGHAEVAKIVFDPQQLSLKTLLSVFFKTHDPTTLNRQGNDIGSQYRSVIFYTSKEQETISNEIIKQLNMEKAYLNPIITEVLPLENYYVADNYHQDYFQLNSEQQYCKYVIQPKVEKFRKVFGEYLK